MNEISTLLRSVLDARPDFVMSDMPNDAAREAMHHPHIHARWELRGDDRGRDVLGDVVSGEHGFVEVLHFDTSGGVKSGKWRWRLPAVGATPCGRPYGGRAEIVSLAF